MGTLAELILVRDKERRRRRSRSATPRMSDAVVAQNQPALRYMKDINILNEGEARLLAVCGVASPWRITLDTPSSSRLAYGQNSGFQCAHYLLETR
jgi:hypothetical protein